MAEGTMVPTTPRQKKRGLKFFLTFIVVLALLMIILYLLSLMHSSKFYLEPEGGTLLVKKGFFLPWGSEIYKPTNPNQAAAYEPIEIPREKMPASTQEFDDLPALNQQYASILIGLAKDLVRSEDEKNFQKGKALFERAKRLEGLSLKQLSDIEADVAEIEYAEAKRIYNGIENFLNEARSKFKKAEMFGSRFPDAAEWIRKVDNLLEVIHENKPIALPSNASPEMPPATK